MYVYLIALEPDKGINPEMLKEKAVSKSILETDAKLTDKDAFLLIFAARFPTATSVTAISGRGVGMDIVSTNIEALGGKVSITSKEGAGSTFIITLPWGL